MNTKYDLITNISEFQNLLRSTLYKSPFKDELLASILYSLNAEGCQDISTSMYSFMIPINDQVNTIKISQIVADCIYKALNTSDVSSYLYKINNLKLYNIYTEIMNNINYVYMLFTVGQLNNNSILLEL